MGSQQRPGIQVARARSPRQARGAWRAPPVARRERSSPELLGLDSGEHKKGTYLAPIVLWTTWERKRRCCATWSVLRRHTPLLGTLGMPKPFS